MSYLFEFELGSATDIGVGRESCVDATPNDVDVHIGGARWNTWMKLSTGCGTEIERIIKKKGGEGQKSGVLKQQEMKELRSNWH